MEFFDLLKASKGLPVRDPLAVLWGKQLSTDWPVISVTGSLPLSFLSKGDALSNYIIYGTSSGVGDETENLMSLNIVQGAIASANGKIEPNLTRVATNNFTLVNAGTYTLSSSVNCKTIGFLYSSASDEDYTGALGGSATWKTLPYTFTISSSSYVRFSFSKIVTGSINPSEITDLMLTSGSTAPASYIPYGYKIPILLHDNKTDNNVFDPSARDVNKGFMTDLYLKGDGTTGASTSWNISEYIDVISGATYDIQWNYSTSTAPAYVFYDKNKNYIGGSAYGNSSHAIVSAPTNARYLRISIYKTIANQIKIMAPNTSNYNIYIGSSKLMEEEYLDYESGKVYKRTEQLITFGEKEFALASKHVMWNTSGNAVRTVTDGNNSAVSGSLSYYKNNLNFTLSAGTYSYTLFRGVESDHDLRIRYLSDNTMVNNGRSGTFTITEATEFYFSIYVNAKVDLDTYDYMVIVEGEEIPETVVPYLQPTDPPVPLPAINTYSGENTLDSSEDVGEVEITGKIREVTE